MIPEHIRERISLFKEEKYVLVDADTTVELEEKQKDGWAVIHCQCDGDTIVLPTPENNVLPYLNDQISGATSCADKFLYSYDGEQWDLHVFELKRTINTSTYAKCKEQFLKGIWNARAVAAFLGMDVGREFLYVGYRADHITEIPPNNLIAMRSANNQQALKLISEWRQNRFLLKTDPEEREYQLQKIQLDENGYGNASV